MPPTVAFLGVYRFAALPEDYEPSTHTAED